MAMLGLQRLRPACNPLCHVSSQTSAQTRPQFVRMAISESAATEEKHMAVKVPRVLSVAGSDSGGGAGIQADIKTCAALGVFCTTAITALTAQNTIGVQGIYPVSADFLERQLRSVLSDIGADVVKTGMLPSADCIDTLCSVLDLFPVRAVVVDPVMVATSGDELAGAGILDALRKKLLPKAEVVTPNLPEASMLLDGASVGTLEEMRKAAAEIHKMGPRYVLIKGGHLSGSDDIVDILYDGSECHEYHGLRVETRNTHGTGCSLASAIAAELAKGSHVRQAVQAAKTYVEKTLQKSAKLTIGSGAQGPLNHVHQLNHWESLGEPHFRPNHLLLYAVTDSSMNKQWGRSTSEAVQAVIEGGATIVQIREKEADSGEFLEEAEASLKIARKYGVPLVINDRIDIALACDADGVHLGQSDLPISRARAILGPKKIIGVSCKTPEQAMRAWEEGADYIGSGGVYPTNTKQNNKTIGVEGLRKVCEASPLPVVAIGGIKDHNVKEVMASPRPEQLQGVAVVSGLFNQPDVVVATQKFRAILADALDDSYSRVV
ncbi:thiamine-phosphate pyrophosphorylase [Marchantia polymorpha subsp. ruderalis]|uniref:Thiamine phosphate synthase n=2 Tax=Marchantia polymorpha TaxID=3197 RepID=A0AAF6BIN3_MARPO|nr:hypothetical protein MARPO_0071s0067 [Marchantia polymorpha]BBN11867.1 hypothetical protein Mp_5g15420 [Marchantia polymorpha subsp. ruderalis]|eukprot:PTQ35453.1 hypothetical protein MARPO_0071s0067 [Marchantia polymorpha]